MCITFVFTKLKLHFYPKKEEVFMKEKEKSYRQTIGKKIKLARARNNYTQEQLAEKLQLSTRYISQLERGISFGSVTTLVNLCNTLEIDADFLFQELVDGNFSKQDKALDEDFFNNYLQLNLYHRKLINSFIVDMLKMQTKDNIKDANA